MNQYLKLYPLNSNILQRLILSIGIVAFLLYCAYDKSTDTSDELIQYTRTEQDILTEIGDYTSNCNSDLIDHVVMKKQEFKVPNAIILRKRDDWKEYIQYQVKEYVGDEDEYSQGILFTASKSSFSLLQRGIRILRYHNCQLPIEVWHFKGEFTSTQYEWLKKHGISPRIADDQTLYKPAKYDTKMERNYQVKATAILNSKFRHVLYLDSDNIPLRDPTYMFYTKEYKEHGAIFWPDYWKTDKKNPIWSILEVQCNDLEREQESGQIFVDRKLSWLPLNLAWYLNSNGDFYYDLLFFDKDTFRFAWKALKKSYHMIDKPVAPLGYFYSELFLMEHIPVNFFCGHTMLQYDVHHVELFAHSNFLKYKLSSIDLSTLPKHLQPFQAIKYLDGNIDLDVPKFYRPYMRYGCVDLAAPAYLEAGSAMIKYEFFDEKYPEFWEIFVNATSNE